MARPGYVATSLCVGWDHFDARKAFENARGVHNVNDVHVLSDLELSVRRPSAHLGWTGLDWIRVIFVSHMGDTPFHVCIMS